MADSIFKAVNNWFRAKNMEAAEAMSDPVRDGKLAISDSEKQIADFTSKIASLIAQTKNLERQLADAKNDVAKFQNVAGAALQAGNENDARDAIALKQKAQQQADTFQSQLTSNNALVTKLRDQLNTARLKVANARSNITQLQARSSAAKIRTDLAKASAQFSSNQGGLAALDNLESQVNKQETEAEAYEELADASSGAPAQKLIEKYTSGDASVDDELQKMKAALAGGSGAPAQLPQHIGSVESSIVRTGSESNQSR
jgi:phage shock protein A